jgi:hypothetical protein
MLAQASGDVAFDKALSPAIADLAVSAMADDLARGPDNPRWRACHGSAHEHGAGLYRGGCANPKRLSPIVDQ